jgi:hypothetical protein
MLKWQNLQSYPGILLEDLKKATGNYRAIGVPAEA